MQDLRAILRHFPELSDSHATTPVRPLAGGLINDTYAVGDRWILQRLHPIFAASVNVDIVALTQRLRDAGVSVPRLLLTKDLVPFVEVVGDREAECGGVWRVMTRLPGRTQHRLTTAREAISAAGLIARFHGALADADHTFAFTRPGAHDTDAHMQALQQQVAKRPDHHLFHEVAALSDSILSLWQRQDSAPGLPLRIGHGDLKVSNLLFGPKDDRATAVIDLDTMAWMTLDVELGDAMRSWCNRAAEDAPAPQLDEALFDAAMRGYASAAAPWVSAVERDAIVAGLLRVSTELSARFAADALHESYFGWNPAVAPSRGVHNLMRAKNQLALARQVAAARPRLEASVRAAFA